MTAPPTRWEDCHSAQARRDWLCEHRGWRFEAGEQAAIPASLDPAKLGREVTCHRVSILGAPRIGDGAQLFDVSLRGESSVGPGAILGRRGPVSLEDATLGARVQFASGAAQQAAVLDDAQLGFATSLRPGTLIDAEASTGQHNDLKNTYLGVATLLGSSTNFCDIALCGGRPGSPVTQTEVGSGSIHFNFGVHGKKWGSWVGSLSGLFLDRERSFIGGNTSLIGPLILPDGIITLVGSQLRAPLELSAAPAPQLLVSRPSELGRFERGFDPSVYGRLTVKWRVSLEVIGRLRALDAWFRVIRARLGEAPETLAAARALIVRGIAERVKWLRAILAELPESIARLPAASERRAAHEALLRRWDEEPRWAALTTLGPTTEAAQRAELEAVAALPEALPGPTEEPSVSRRIGAIPEGARIPGRRWLEAIAAESAGADA